jgi:UDP-3-O-[3-hydroxymyristoyl] glucosamine N-acyltransferase
MSYTLLQLAEHLESLGMRARVETGQMVTIDAVNTLEDAGPTEISFLANQKYEKQLATTRAGAVVVPESCQIPSGLSVIRAADPYAAITALIVHLHGYRKHPRWGVSPAAHLSPEACLGANANVAPTATIARAIIGRNANIYPGCYVADGCVIGDDVTLFPNVVIYDGSVLGHRVTIHAGSVIGEDGLGYAPVNGKWIKIPQAGTVIIADDVEIGANCAIDRATLGHTVIGRGTKFSNLIAVGHGTKIGEDCLLVAQVGLAGSVKVGNHVQIAGQAGAVGHITIGDNATVGAKAGVTNDVPEGTTVLGQPAVPIRDCKRQVAMVQRLPEIRNQIKSIEDALAQLQAQADGRSGRKSPGDGQSTTRTEQR